MSSYKDPSEPLSTPQRIEHERERRCALVEDETIHGSASESRAGALGSAGCELVRRSWFESGVPTRGHRQGQFAGQRVL